MGDVAVRKLSVRDIDAFYRALRRAHGLAPSTVRQIHNVLTGSLDRAVRWGWRTDNPARLATLPPQHQAEVHSPSPAAVLAAIEAADEEFAIFVRVSAAIGGRRGEVEALRWPVVDLERGELKVVGVVVRALVESADGSIYEKDTKTHQVRRVALDGGTVAVLQWWRRIVDKRAADAGVELLADGFVFSSEVDGSRPWRPYRWTSVWRRVRQKAGIDPNVRLHELRRFAATHLLDAGVPVRTVRARLGHAWPANV